MHSFVSEQVLQGTACLVVGAGSLGMEIIDQLLAVGARVRVLDVAPLEKDGVEVITADIRDKAAVSAACRGMSLVFQNVSMIDWNPNPHPLLQAINVEGNRIVIAACLEQGVGRLVYTSSIDVVFDGSPIANGDETLPYPRHHLDPYSTSKMQAEQDVIAANGQSHTQGEGRLLTCSLRVAGLYGPSDRVRFPTLLPQLKQGLSYRMGNGRNKFNHVYTGNAAYAHLLAACHLTEGFSVAGECYFIVDHEATNFFDHIALVGEKLGYPIPDKTIPAWLLWTLGYLSEWKCLLLKAKTPPPLTRYTAACNLVDFYFNSTKAQRDFGYQPRYAFDEAIENTVRWLRDNGYAYTP